MDVNFKSFNTQLAKLKASGVRIYGPNASVAQDIEPEYITFSQDGNTAVVTLQENNALAIVDLKSKSVTEIVPLGLKNHNQNSSSIHTYQFGAMPSIGNTLGAQSIKLGGFSGLHYMGKSRSGKLQFVTHTDRGPNGEPTGVLRPFMLPNFSPEIIKFELDTVSGILSITERIPLKYSNNKALTGLPNLVINNNGSTPYNDETPVNIKNEAISTDSLGGDFEGIVIDPVTNNYWMVDEYRPAIYEFNPNGVLVNRYVPKGTAAASGKTEGYYGIEALPAIIGNRRQNRGFEAVALNPSTGKLYAFVQSPLRNPATLSNSVLNGLANIRVVEFDTKSRTTTGQYLYTMDNPNLNTANNTRADKIGDAVYHGKNQFLVVERDDDALTSGDPISNIEKKVYKISFEGATNINGNDSIYQSISKTIDQMLPSELEAQGVMVAKKELYIDLAKAGYTMAEKVEGLALLDSNKIAVINDNDFEVGAVTINATSGTFTPNPNPEPITLGIIKIQSNGMDASDRDLSSSSGKINIKKHPVHGMYMPDAIASVCVNGKCYYITANEGDSRDYTGFSEEIRVGASGYVLDPTIFPNASDLKANANLGRLQLSNASGDIDGDGDFDQIHALGARSFTVWNEKAELVYDSGDEIEQLIAKLSPSTFNSDGLAASFDNRSDNKGPEPEGVAIGKIGSNTYAFIGLERVGDIMVFNINNPLAPKFEKWLDAAEDISPEGLLFIDSTESPTGKSILVVSFEVSKTITVYQFDGTITANESFNLASHKNTVYVFPNPANSNSTIEFSDSLTGSLYNSLGQEISNFEKTQSLSTAGLQSGIYSIKTSQGQTLKLAIQ
jgi:hypothetical protein